MIFQDVFSSREIASIIWTGIFILWVLQKAKVRKAVKQAVIAFFHWKIICPIALLLLYISSIVFILNSLHFWSKDLLKETITWTITSAVYGYMNLYKYHSMKQLFENQLSGYLKLLVIYEFMFNSFTYNLALELVLIPVVTFIILLHAVSEKNEKYKSLTKVFYYLQSMIGIVMIISTVTYTLKNALIMLNFEKLKSFFLGPLLSLMIIPFMYIFMIIFAYELVFMRVNISKADKYIKKKAKFELMKILGINLTKINKAKNMGLFNLMSIEGIDDINEMKRVLRLNL
jgi:hypothetical protein